MTINHTSLLQALLHCARHFCDSSILGKEQEALQHSWATDKTGTINTACLLKLSDEEIQQKKAREIIAAEVNDEILRVHGHIPPKKGEGIVPLIYKNVNGFNNPLNSNDKVEKAKEIHDDLEIDIATYCKHQLNMCHKKNSN